MAKKELTLAELLKKEEKLLTVFGVFTAVVAYFTQINETNSLLSFLGFALLVLMLGAVIFKLYSYENQNLHTQLFLVTFVIFYLVLFDFFIKNYKPWFELINQIIPLILALIIPFFLLDKTNEILKNKKFPGDSELWRLFIPTIYFLGLWAVAHYGPWLRNTFGTQMQQLFAIGAFIAAIAALIEFVKYSYTPVITKLKKSAISKTKKKLNKALSKIKKELKKRK
ncbi:MAG: hypothetical protein ACE5DI_03490 [Candidatus Micrarchaeia archaeon]